MSVAPCYNYPVRPDSRVITGADSINAEVNKTPLLDVLRVEVIGCHLRVIDSLLLLAYAYAVVRHLRLHPVHPAPRIKQTQR